MNRLEKDLLFYSNYCLHSTNLINTISKTELNDKVFYICIDDKKIKIPQFITRVPSVFLVGTKKVLVEEEIDLWLQSKLKRNLQNEQTSFNNARNMNQMPPHSAPPLVNSRMPDYNQQMPPQNYQQQTQMPPQNYQQQTQMPQHNQQQTQMPQQNQQMPPNQQMPQQNLQMPLPNKSSTDSTETEGGDIMAYHSNEMGASMSGKYSFLDESDNSSLNYNFSFIGDNNSDTRINTPKDFSSTSNTQKSKSESDYEKLLEQRSSESFAKGVQRI